MEFLEATPCELQALCCQYDAHKTPSAKKNTTYTLAAQAEASRFGDSKQSTSPLENTVSEEGRAVCVEIRKQEVAWGTRLAGRPHKGHWGHTITQPMAPSQSACQGTRAGTPVLFYFYFGACAVKWEGANFPCQRAPCVKCCGEQGWRPGSVALKAMVGSEKKGQGVSPPLTNFL